MHFVGNFILNKSCEFYYDDVIMTSFIARRCQMRTACGAWLPWKPCSWYSTRTKLFKLNRSATDGGALCEKSSWANLF